MPRGRPKGSKNKVRTIVKVEKPEKRGFRKKGMLEPFFEKCAEAIWHNHHHGVFHETDFALLFPSKWVDRNFQRFKRRMVELGVPHRLEKNEVGSVGVVMLLDSDELEEKFGGKKR